MKRNRSRDHETRIHERASRGERKRKKRRQKRMEEKREEREREKDGMTEVTLCCFHRDAIKDAILDRN